MSKTPNITMISIWNRKTGEGRESSWSILMVEELQCFAFNYKELYRTSISSASNQEENNYWLGNQSILGD